MKKKTKIEELIQLYEVYAEMVDGQVSTAVADPYILLHKSAQGNANQYVLTFGPRGNQPNEVFSHTPVSTSMVRQYMKKITLDDLPKAARKDTIAYILDKHGGPEGQEDA